MNAQKVINPTLKRLTIIESGLNFGNLDDKYSIDAKSNRNKLYKLVGTSHQNAIYIDAEGKDKYIDIKDGKNIHNKAICDAIITTSEKISLALFPADCVPLVIYSEHPQVLALVHLGWRGCIMELHNKVLQHLVFNYKVRPSELVSYIGFSIKKESYLLPSIHEKQRSKAWEPYISQIDNNYSVDLQGYIISELLRVGVKKSKIICSGIDTAESSSGYFSNYRSRIEGSKPGRNGFIVKIT